jgi:predicted short-subunit dehydrogenase-like oxidoreductase (DUF2520 family)
MKVIILGSGNVATLLGASLLKSGYNIIQVWSRNLVHAKALGNLLHTQFTCEIDQVIDSADLYFLSVSDDAIPSVISRLKPIKGIIVHTSGSTSIDIFNNSFSHYGVFYPFQTFSIGKDMDFKTVPILLESSDTESLSVLRSVALSLSGNVQECSSEQRKVLHIAAVFASNFTNHFYAISQKLLEENGLDFDLIRPLILETALKVQGIMPNEAQTGPAVRNDFSIINSHLKQLESKPELSTIYRLLSEQIATFTDKYRS